MTDRNMCLNPTIFFFYKHDQDIRNHPDVHFRQETVQLTGDVYVSLCSETLFDLSLVRRSRSSFTSRDEPD